MSGIENIDMIEEQPEEKERKNWTLRAVIFGVVLGMFGVWMGVLGEVYGLIPGAQNILITSEEPINLALFSSMLALIIMCLIVPRLLRQKNGFSRLELIVTFAVGLGVHNAGYATRSIIKSIASFGVQYTTSPGEFTQFWDPVPAFVQPKDFDVIVDLLMGWADVPWGPWILPMLFWFFVVFLLTIVPICMGVLMRKRWADRERLTFPLARATLHLLDVEDDGSGRVKGFWKNKLLWQGAAVTFFLVFYEWLQMELVPGLPVINRTFLGNLLGQVRNSSPGLSYSMGAPAANLWGFRSWGVVGVLYLAPSHDFLYTWVILTPVNWLANYVIYLTRHSFPSLMYSFNLTADTIYHLSKRSTYVAVIAFAIYTVWRSRGEIGETLKNGFSKKDNSYHEEGLTVKEASYGVLLGTAILFAIMIWVLKMNFIATFIFIVSFWGFNITIGRFRAEVAFPSAGNLDIRFFSQSTLHMFGADWMPSEVMRGASYLTPHQRHFGATLAMAHSVEGYKMSDEVNLKRRTFTKSYLIGFLLAAIPSTVLFLRGFYDVGTGVPSAWGVDLFRRLPTTLPGRTVRYQFNMFNIGYSFLFAAVVLLFGALRANYIWWPFHPLGLIMANTPNMSAHIGGAATVTFIAKWFILRYGGGKLYNQLTPFFVGLILGEVLGFLARWIGLTIILGLR